MQMTTLLSDWMKSENKYIHHKARQFESRAFFQPFTEYLIDIKLELV